MRGACTRVWCLLFVLIRHGLRGGSGPHRLIRALGEEAGNPIMAFHRPSFFPSTERALHHTTTEYGIVHTVAHTPSTSYAPTHSVPSSR